VLRNLQNLLFLTVLIPVNILRAQPIIVDKIVGVVGKNQILYSDIEDQYMQSMAQGVKPMPTRCQIFEDLLAQKLLVNQADVDSILVDEAQVEMELTDRINYFVNQIGSEQKLIEYFGKSILEIKEDMRDAVRDQMLMQRMRMEITSNMSVTPAEVKSFYKSLPEDSIPYVEAEVEINQLVLHPSTSDEAVFEVRERLLGLRERIVNGENFATLAVLYSEGPSASRGGDIGWASKADLDPAYAKAAFALKKGQVSKIVESSFGYHIIQLTDRTEERVQTRHILMKPKISPEAKEKTQHRLDSIITLIRMDTLTFERAAQRFSQDEDTRANGGLMVNPRTGNTKFELDQFEGREYFLIRDLKVGEMSEPYESTDDKGNLVYKVIRLKSKTEPHKANLKDDYELLKQMTSLVKQNEIVDDWVEDKIRSTYIRINDPYDDCTFRLKGWQQN
jgi:peptidyl-prolyl cis-trans isomerase SurA